MFSIGDTLSEHSTHEHDTRSTLIEHHHQDNMCITTMTDEELTSDDDDKMGKGSKAAAEQFMQDMETEYKVVYDGKIMTPRSIKQLKNHTIVRIVDRMIGGGKKKARQRGNNEFLRK